MTSVFCLSRFGEQNPFSGHHESPSLRTQTYFRSSHLSTLKLRVERRDDRKYVSREVEKAPEKASVRHRRK